MWKILKNRKAQKNKLDFFELTKRAVSLTGQFKGRSDKELKDWIDECEERIKALERLQETEGDSRPTSKWMLINEKTGEVIVKMDNVKFSAPFPDRLIC